MAVSENIQITLEEGEDVKLIRESDKSKEGETFEESKLKTEARIVHLNVEYYHAIAKIIEELQRENLKKIERLLIKIFSVKDINGGKETTEFISTVLHLFNTVLRQAFFKTFLRKLFNKTQKPIPLEDTKFRAELSAYARELDPNVRHTKGLTLFEKMFKGFAIDLKGAIIDSLERNKGFEELIEAAQNEFKNIFFKMEENIFINFLKIFRLAFIYEIEESLNFVKAYPEKWEYSVYSEEDETFLTRTVYTIQHAFDTIKTALRKTQETRGIVVHQPIPRVEKVSSIESLNPVLKGYLLAIMQDTLQDNPLKDQLESVLQVIGTIKSKSTRRHSAQTVPAVTYSERRSGRGASLPSITGDSVIRVDMGDNQGQWFFPDAFPTLTDFGESTQQEDEDNDRKGSREIFQVISGSMPRIRRRLKICPIEDQEKFAALCVRNPFVEGINDGRALHDSLGQILKLYPDARSKMLPYLIVFDTVGGTIGGLIGRHAILNPKKPLNAGVRVWKAITDGTVLFTFSMGTVIQIYLSVYPSEGSVSDKKFWSELAVGPVILFLSKSVWDSISPATKDKWFPQDTRWRYVRNTVDGFLEFLYYGRIFDISLLNFFDISGHPVYQWVSSGLALSASLIKRLTRHRETTNAVMTYLASANFSYRLFKEDLLPNGIENAEVSPTVTYVYRIYWPAFFVASSGFILRHGVRFTREFEGEPKDVVTRRVTVHSNSSVNNQYPTVNVEDYQLLVEFSEKETKKEKEQQHRRGSDSTWSAFPSSPPPIIYMQRRDSGVYGSREDLPSQSTSSDLSEVIEKDRKRQEGRRFSNSTQSALPLSGSPPITYMQQRYNEAYDRREDFLSQSRASDPSSKSEIGRDEEIEPPVHGASMRRKNYRTPCPCPCPCPRSCTIL